MTRNRKSTDARALVQSIDWPLIAIPFAVIVTLSVLFFIIPEQSRHTLDLLRGFLGDQMGFWYILVGLGAFLFSLFLAFSRYGAIVLGKSTDGEPLEKPAYSGFKWGTMIFTSTMAADILFYSLCEWSLYGTDPRVEQMGGMQMGASTYPLFHWGPIPWSFYIVLAVAFAFMLHIRGRTKQKFSEACRPLLGDRVDGIAGKVINLIAAFALLAGTATTFSVATPLLSAAICSITGLSDSIGLTVCVLLLIAVIYSLAVWFGMKAIARLAAICVYVFFVLLLYVFVGGGQEVYIVETGISAIGNMIQNFFGLSTWMDPLRETSFPQNWTIFYWAYWMAWCVATPFFIATISKGRTVRNVILGGYSWALAGTFLSFIVLGNYGLYLQMSGAVDTAGAIAAGGDMAQAILGIFDTLPLPTLGLALLALAMIGFYATTFDALSMVMSIYTYHQLGVDKEPDKRVRVFWCVLFILLPIALLFAQNTLNNLQSVSIIAAFPISIIIVMICVSFVKDARLFLNEERRVTKPKRE
jgi:BCCT family betaine/carnitine transporter